MWNAASANVRLYCVLYVPSLFRTIYNFSPFAPLNFQDVYLQPFMNAVL